MNTAVLFLPFIRPELGEQTFNQIKKVQPPRLYIAIDGPRNENDKILIEKTKNYLTIDWRCEVKYLLHDENLGCDKAIASAVTWFFENEEQGIILEEDCFPDETFFYFCEELLIKYKNDTRIMHISGRTDINNNLSYKYSYTFKMGMDCWGWASWRRAWKYFDPEMKNYSDFKLENAIRMYIDEQNEQEFSNMLENINRIKPYAWDWIYLYNLLCQNALCINSKTNLVKNIGMNSVNSVHVQEGVENINNEIIKMEFPLKHPIFIGFYKHLSNSDCNKTNKISLANIFSVKNDYSNNCKHKVITFLGIKIKIKILKINNCEKITSVDAHTYCSWEKLLYPEEEFTMPSCVDIMGNIYDEINKNSIIPPFYVRSFQNGICYTNKEEIFISNNKVIDEYTQLKTNRMVGLSALNLDEVTKINGKVVHLSLSELENNYYHWNIEAMSRLYLIFKANIKPDYYIVSQKHLFQKEFLKLLGIKENQIIPAEENKLVQAKELIIASNLKGNYEINNVRGYTCVQKQWLPYWIGNLHKEYIIPNIDGYHFEKIYITRRNAKYRKIINEDEILNVLKKYDFKVLDLDNLSLIEQIKYFKNAKYIVGIHGAGLVNAIYTQGHNCTVFELCPQNYHDSGFKILDKVLNINHKFMIGKTYDAAMHPQLEDAWFDPIRFENELQKDMQML